MAEHKRKNDEGVPKIEIQVEKAIERRAVLEYIDKKRTQSKKFAFLKMDEYNRAYNQMKGSQERLQNQNKVMKWEKKTQTLKCL